MSTKPSRTWLMKKEHSIEFRMSDKRESPLHFQANKKYDGIHGC